MVFGGCKRAATPGTGKRHHARGEDGRKRPSKAHPPEVQRSSMAEVLFASLVLVATVAMIALVRHGPVRFALTGLWVFQAMRLHLQVWYFGGWPSFVFISRRFPHAYIWTLSVLPIAPPIKLLQWTLAQLLFDDLGHMYRSDGSNVTLVRWWRAAMDLNKPLRPPPRQRASDGDGRVDSLTPTRFPVAVLMVNILSPTLACSVLAFGPWAVFDVQRMICSENHVLMRNDLLGTNFSYHHHTSGFCDMGTWYWVVAETAVLPPFTWLRAALWDAYARDMCFFIDEAEERCKHHPTQTYLGTHWWTDMDPPSLDSLFYPEHAGTRERRLSVEREGHLGQLGHSSGSLI